MKEEYQLTVGLEIHAELCTNTKMFCACKNDPDEKVPNINVCPVCMAHPGSLPVINKEAVRSILRVGVAVGGEVAAITEFDRKNYFYPDIPKGYQISQFAHPLVRGGSLTGKEITRIHLEEDTARSSHEEGGSSLIDFNRAGLPLMELVTEPHMHSAKEAVRFAKELQLLLRTLGVAHANMEKGEMRVEANISVSKTPGVFGTKVEVKNLNSFKSVERAIEFEYDRQTTLLEKGEKVIQETRGFDEVKGTTFSQRLKEESHDYRYFPDPDLPKLDIKNTSEFSKENLLASLPELPDSLRARLERRGVREEDREMFVADARLRSYVEILSSLLSTEDTFLLAVNYLSSDIAGMRNVYGDAVFERITPEKLAEVASMASSKELSSRGVKDVLMYMQKGEEGTGRSIAEKLELFQTHDSSDINQYVEEVLLQAPDVVREFKAGKEASLKYLVGQGMKISKGKANPALLEEALRSRISELS